MKGSTRLYLSGVCEVENFMLKHPERFPNTGLMLSYYDFLKSTVRAELRLKAVISGVPNPIKPSFVRQERV